LNSIEETDFSGSIEELFSNLDNVVIEGVGEKQVDFITSAGYESVIKLQNCSNITIRNLNMGHAEALIDVCSGDVVEIVSCNNITIENSTLFGCGVKGLAIRYSNTVELIDSVIKECSEAIAYVELSSNIRFTNSVFKDNNGGINTNDVRDFVIEQCQIIGDDQLPELSDSTQYYYLTNEGMISDSYKGYLSAYIENQEDWISGVIVKNTFLSRKYVIDDHLALKKALEEKLTNQKMDIDVNRIRTNSDYRKLEISMNLQDRINQWSKEDICSYVYQFKKTEAVLEAFDFNEIVFKFRYEAKDRSLIDGLSVFMNKDMFIQYLSSENQTDIDKYGTIISSNEEIDFSEFLQTGAQFNTVDEAREDIKAKLVLVESISDLDERTIQIFENFGEDNFQFLEYQNAQIENQKLYYYFGVKQKEPLFGDFIHHSYFSNLKVDAMTGVVYEVDLITGEREVKEKNEEVKKTIMDYAKSIESEYMIDQKYSMFLTLDSSQGSRLVKVQFFSEDMGSRGYGIYTLEMSDGKWVVKDVVKGESLYDQSEYKILLEEYNKNVERERFKKENERKFQEVKSDGFHPILLSGGFDITGPNYVIGGLLDQGWCNDRKKLAEYFNGTETYKVYSFDESLGDWNGSKVIFDEETETYRIELKDEKGSEFSGQYMAVEGDWDALPRIPKRKDNIDEYKTAMIDIVRAQGIREQDLKIAEVIGVDLEGDGTEEIIVTAENYKLVSKSSYNYYRQYYVIAMFKIVDGKLESVVLEDDYGYSWNYDSNAVTHILDLDGDGKMEIVLKSMFQDDIGVDVLEINGLNIKKVLEYGFGAY